MASGSVQPTVENAPTSFFSKLKSLGWRRVVLVFASLSAGVVLALVLLGWGIYSFQNRAIAPKSWPPVELTAIGIKLNLKTDWNGTVRYQFAAFPSANKYEKDFDLTSRQSFNDLNFHIFLYDKAGFEICDHDVPLRPVMGDDGRMAALVGNDNFYCSREAYASADSWNATFRFPALVSSAGSPDNSAIKVTTPAGKSELHSVTKTRTRSPEDDSSPSTDKAIVSQWEDTVTGYDYANGHLTLKSGTTLLIKRGEQTTAEMWASSASLGRAPKLTFSCDSENNCLIENPATGQFVHGKYR